MTQTNVQSIPELENDNLLAKIFTSRKWQKKLSNQNMNYQWIPCDQAQTQTMLSQVQVNIPNSSVNSCESDYFTTTMKMKISASDINAIAQSQGFGVDEHLRAAVVQYMNALYIVMFNEANVTAHNASHFLEEFAQAIKTTSITNGDINGNTADYGAFINFKADENWKLFGTNNAPTVPIPSGTDLSTSQTFTFNYQSQTYKVVVRISDATIENQFNIVDGDNNPTNYYITIPAGFYSSTTTDRAATFVVEGVVPPISLESGVNCHGCYQKIMNLPYNSACFMDRTVLSHENVDKSKPLQQINRLIFRQQYCPNTTQQYINQHWYIYYGNNIPQIIYASKEDDNITSNGLTFSYQIITPMNKLFWMWQQDFLPLFKLKNPLHLQFVFNTSYLKDAFNVLMNVRYASNTIGTLAATPKTFIDYNSITYYNIGCYLLMCNDTVMEKKLMDELNDMQGIVLPQTQTWIESYKTSTDEQKQYMTNIGFNCLTNIEMSLYANTNNAFYRGYSSLRDICNEYYNKIDANTVQMYNPSKDSYGWYQKRLSFYMPQITLNAKQTFIGQKFLNSIPLFLSINNRGQDKDDQNPFTQNLFDYFNKLNIRYEQFTDKYVKDVEADEMNYSGVSIKKSNNNYIICQLADYNTQDFQANLQPYNQDILTIKGGQTSKDYFVELVYKYKQILQIDQQGNLTQMLQEYML